MALDYGIRPTLRRIAFSPPWWPFPISVRRPSPAARCDDLRPPRHARAVARTPL